MISIYSRLGQLLQADTPEQSIEYRHNALGQRVAKLVNGQVTEKYLWRDLTTLLATYDANGNVKQRFEHTLGHTPTSFTQGGQRYFIQSDHLGSPRVITDSNGNIIKAIDYDSYGNIIHDSNESFEIPFGFAGGLRDKDTGLIRFGFRDYDPNTGRWTARDPIGFAGGDTNLYGYVLGDPVNWVDSDGLRNVRPTSNAWNRFQARHGGRGYTKAQLRDLYRQLKLNKLGGPRNPELHEALENLPDRVEEAISIPNSCVGAVCQVEVEVCLCSKRNSLSCPVPGQKLELPWEELKKDCTCWTEYRTIPGL